MTAKELAIAYAMSVPDDISVPHLQRLIEANGWKTLEDVREAFRQQLCDTLEERGTSARAEFPGSSGIPGSRESGGPRKREVG